MSSGYGPTEELIIMINHILFAIEILSNKRNHPELKYSLSNNSLIKI